MAWSESFRTCAGSLQRRIHFLTSLRSVHLRGERLAAVALLQVFASERSLPFLVKLVGSEKPFVGYHATKALRFAVGALESQMYSQLLDAIHEAQQALRSARVGFDADRQKELRAAEQELQETIAALAAPVEQHD